MGGGPLEKGSFAIEAVDCEVDTSSDPRLTPATGTIYFVHAPWSYSGSDSPLEED